MINLLRVIGAFLFQIRILIVVVLAIGLPVYIYLAFVAKEPVFPPEQDDWLAFQQSLPEQSPPAEPDSSRDEGDAGSNSIRQE